MTGHTAGAAAGPAPSPKTATHGEAESHLRLMARTMALEPMSATSSAGCHDAACDPETTARRPTSPAQTVITISAGHATSRVFNRGAARGRTRRCRRMSGSRPICVAANKLRPDDEVEHPLPRLRQRSSNSRSFCISQESAEPLWRLHEPAEDEHQDSEPRYETGRGGGRLNGLVHEQPPDSGQAAGPNGVRGCARPRMFRRQEDRSGRGIDRVEIRGDRQGQRRPRACRTPRRQSRTNGPASVSPMKNPPMAAPIPRMRLGSAASLSTADTRRHGPLTGRGRAATIMSPQPTPANAKSYRLDRASIESVNGPPSSAVSPSGQHRDQLGRGRDQRRTDGREQPDRPPDVALRDRQVPDDSRP